MEEILTKILGVVKWLQIGGIIAGVFAVIVGLIMLYRTSKRDAGKDTIFYSFVAMGVIAFVVILIKFFIGTVLGYPELVNLL